MRLERSSLTGLGLAKETLTLEKQTLSYEGKASQFFIFNWARVRKIVHLSDVRGFEERSVFQPVCVILALICAIDLAFCLILYPFPSEAGIPAVQNNPKAYLLEMWLTGIGRVPYGMTADGLLRMYIPVQAVHGIGLVFYVFLTWLCKRKYLFFDNGSRSGILFRIDGIACATVGNFTKEFVLAWQQMKSALSMPEVTGRVCPKCHTKNIDGDFCEKCGTKLA